MRSSAGLPTVFILLLALGGFAIVLWRNAQPAPPLRAVIPTQVEPTRDSNPWQAVLQAGFGQNTTPLPTIGVVQPYVAPTLPPVTAPTETPFAPPNPGGGELYTLQPVSVAATPTLPPSPVVIQTEVPVTVQVAPTAIMTWQPPPLVPPLSRDPLGRDHYYFIRPVDSNANNRGLPYYPYGSDGQQHSNPSRVHHGIDMANPVGETVRAAGTGVVIYAPSPEQPVFQNTPSYGNVVVIEHDFGWNGQPLYTLYAHLATALVQTGQFVEAGDPIGLIGNTGQTTGPHVHFEVRVGQNRYASTFNPLLWMVPYVGHGTIAGLLIDERGRRLDDFTITLRNVTTNLQEATTTTYIYNDTAIEVNADPGWAENFVFGDVPVGRYEVIATYNGVRISRIVDVREGETSFVELRPAEPATAQPVTPAP